MAAGTSTRIGAYVTRRVAGEAYRCHVPARLPPDRPLDLARLFRPLERHHPALMGRELGQGLDQFAKALALMRSPSSVMP